MTERDGATDLQVHGAINVNKAPRESLLGLPSMTEDLARFIIDHRPFTAWDDLAAEIGADVTRDMRKGGAVLI